VIAPLQANPLANIRSSGLHTSRPHASGTAAAIRIEPVVGYGREFNLSRLGAIGDFESHREISGSPLLRPIGIDGDFQRFDVVGAVFGEGGKGEQEDYQDRE
jgi:hypothetical protein